MPGARRRARAGAAARRRRATRSGCPRSTSTRSAPAAARSRGIDAGRRARRRTATARARCPDRRATAAAATDADGHRRRSRARPHPGRCRVPRSRVGSTWPPRARALERGGRDGRRRRAVVDAAMEQAVRVVTVERGVDPRDLALGGVRRRRTVARVRGRRRARHARVVIVPPRAGVFSAPGIVVRAEGARGGPQLRGRRSRRPTLGRASPPKPRARGRRRARTSRPRSTAATSARATSSPCRRRTTSPPSTSGATVTPGPGAPVEVVAVRARASARRRRSRSPTCPRSTRAAVRGPAVVAEPDCTVWVPDGLAGGAAASSARGSLERR